MVTSNYHYKTVGESVTFNVIYGKQWSHGRAWCDGTIPSSALRRLCLPSPINTGSLIHFLHPPAKLP